MLGGESTALRIFLSLLSAIFLPAPPFYICWTCEKRGESPALWDVWQKRLQIFLSVFFVYQLRNTTTEEDTKKENKTMIIVGQLICIFAKTVDMAMHLSVKKLVRKWKVLLKRLKRNYFSVHFGRKFKWKIVFSMRIKCMSKTINGNWKWLSLLHLTMSRWINSRPIFQKKSRFLFNVPYF